MCARKNRSTYIKKEETKINEGEVHKGYFLSSVTSTFIKMSA